jgi:hypothetical protein
LSDYDALETSAAFCGLYSSYWHPDLRLRFASDYSSNDDKTSRLILNLACLDVEAGITGNMALQILAVKEATEVFQMLTTVDRLDYIAAHLYRREARFSGT